jgi:uncharacterized protein GlcG (DUF336 family)
MSDLTRAHRAISLEGAQALVSAATAKAAELGLRVVVCVVDDSGVVTLQARMDDAPLMAIDLAHRKALTAVGYGLPTGAPWYGFVKDDPILLEGTRTIPGFTMLGGGLPLRVDDRVVGAIGVSGGHYSQDEQCAQAAVRVLEARA